MASPPPSADPIPEATGDVEMAEETIDEGAAEFGNLEPEIPQRVTFLDYLKSPIVELIVGQGEDQSELHAHEALLVQSPWFAEQCAKFSGKQKRRVDLFDEDLQAVGSVLEYLYNGEYFPKRIGSSKDKSLEADPSIPSPDDHGVALLRHARVYALADKLGMPALKSLAHSKIHRTSSTARGEIAYARFVYGQTSPEDTTIRRPVAAFWATRSHVLRHEAELEFRAMCLEYPQFGFDVLTLVLDQKERKGGGATIGVELAVSGGNAPSSGPSGRKRARMSHGSARG